MTIPATAGLKPGYAYIKKYLSAYDYTSNGWIKTDSLSFPQPTISSMTIPAMAGLKLQKLY